MSEKLIGYILLVIGVAVILFSALSVYQVLTAKAKPADFVKPGGKPTINLSIPGPTGQNIPVPLDLGDLVPMNQLINASVHVILMGFLASMGGKLAMIGTNLVRPIAIKAPGQ